MRQTDANLLNTDYTRITTLSKTKTYETRIQHLSKTHQTKTTTSTNNLSSTDHWPTTTYHAQIGAL